MANCQTCGAEIEVPEGWSVGSAARRHYWTDHPDRMLKPQADRAALSPATPPASAGPSEPPSPPRRRRPRPV